MWFLRNIKARLMNVFDIDLKKTKTLWRVQVGVCWQKVEINALWMQSNAAVLWKKEKERSCIEARVEPTCSYNRPVIFWFAENIDRRWSSLASFPYSQFSLSWEQVDSEKKNLHSITYIHVYIELVSFLGFFFLLLI